MYACQGLPFMRLWSLQFKLFTHGSNDRCLVRQGARKFSFFISSKHKFMYQTRFTGVVTHPASDHLQRIPTAELWPSSPTLVWPTALPIRRPVLYLWATGSSFEYTLKPIYKFDAGNYRCFISCSFVMILIFNTQENFSLDVHNATSYFDIRAEQISSLI